MGACACDHMPLLKGPASPLVCHKKKRKEKAIKNYSNKKNRDKTAYLRYITKTIKKKNVSMHELSNAESVTCSQEKLQYLLVELTSILDILVELSEDHDDFSFNKIYSKQKF